jgi:hypothetical protein
MLPVLLKIGDDNVIAAMHDNNAGPVNDTGIGAPELQLPHAAPIYPAPMTVHAADSAPTPACLAAAATVNSENTGVAVAGDLAPAGTIIANGHPAQELMQPL